MKVTIKLKQGKCMMIKIMATTPTWNNSMVNKQRWRQRNQKRRKAKQRMALRLPRPYILVHNRNRIENAPYDSVILLYLMILNNFLLSETHPADHRVCYRNEIESYLNYLNK